MVKDVIRKYQTQYPTSYWSDMVPHALTLMRFTTTRAHGFPPYTLVIGCNPELPTALNTTIASLDHWDELTSNQEEQYGL
mgnify:FL=1